MSWRRHDEGTLPRGNEQGTPNTSSRSTDPHPCPRRHRVPLVLCSGIGASLEVLDPLVEHLNPDTTVVRFDVPALGLHPIHPYPMAFRIWPCCFDGFSTSWASSLENRSDARSCGDLVRERDEIIDSLGDGHAGGGAVARILLRAIQNALGDDGDLPQCQRVPES